MADGFFGELLAPAEVDLRAAAYLRHRIESVSEAVRLMLARLETHAQEFEARGHEHVEEHVRALSDTADDPEVADRDTEGMIRAIKRFIARSEPGPERIEDCKRMIAEAGASDDLQKVLRLIGEELVLPDEPGPNSRNEAEGGGQKQTVAHAQPSRRLQPAPAAQGATREPARAATERRPQAPPAEGADPLQTEEFFGVVVPAHEHDKARLIIADARERALAEGHYTNSLYVNGRGLNAWQPKLLKAAFANALSELPPVPTAEATPVAVEPAPEPSPAPGEADETIAEPEMELDVSAEPVDEFFGEGDEDVAEVEAAAEDGPEDLFAEPLDEDHDDAPEITAPLQPPPRPEPTVLHPAPASRATPPPVRQGAGLMASRVGAPAHAKSFLPRGRP